VRAASTDGSYTTRDFTIAISDVNEFALGAVSDADGGAADSVNENSVNGTAVGITAAANDADVTVGCNEDHSPAGVYITRCSALRHISPIGFVDIKEQWLACASEQGLRVRVHEFSSPGAIPLRTRADFLVAARYLNNQFGSVADRSS